ncbi:MAG: PorT family protein [Alphaproteobacteria bacterium]|nr:PorT family protein [Alphaproteobacteria bacterium]
MNPSLGFIRSSGFKKASQAIESKSNGSIQEYDVRAKAGFQFGVGGFFQYEVNERFTVLTDPSFNYFRSKITQNYIAQVYTSNNQEVQNSIRSVAQIKYFYLNIPIMVKYEVLPYQKVFVSGGASVNINMSPKVYADEDSVTNFIQQGEIYATSVKKISSQATLNNFSPVSVNLNLGVGKSFLMGRYYNLDIELRYQFPLTSTAMYTTDETYASETVLNSVFSQTGKENVEDSSGKSLNRFRSSVLSLSIRYILWSK